MPERSSKRKTRKGSLISSLGEPVASSLRTIIIPSISDRDFSEKPEKIEKSISRRIKDTKTGQREILRMFENLSSKTDSLSGQTSSTVDLDANENHPESLIPTSRPIEVNELIRGEDQHIVTGVTVPQEIPTRSSSLPPPNQKYPDDIVNKLLGSLKNVTQQNLGLPRLPKALSTTMPTFDGTDVTTNSNTSKICSPQASKYIQTSRKKSKYTLSTPFSEVTPCKHIET